MSINSKLFHGVDNVDQVDLRALMNQFLYILALIIQAEVVKFMKNIKEQKRESNFGASWNMTISFASDIWGTSLMVLIKFEVLSSSEMFMPNLRAAILLASSTLKEGLSSRNDILEVCNSLSYFMK